MTRNNQRHVTPLPTQEQLDTITELRKQLEEQHRQHCAELSKPLGRDGNSISQGTALALAEEMSREFSLKASVVFERGYCRVALEPRMSEDIPKWAPTTRDNADQLIRDLQRIAKIPRITMLEVEAYYKGFVKSYGQVRELKEHIERYKRDLEDMRRHMPPMPFPMFIRGGYGFHGG